MARAAPEDPLEQLNQTIRAARELPTPEPHLRDDDPLRRLRAQIYGQPQESRPTEPGTPLESLVGREVLAMLSERPLSAEARAEAVRRLAVALQSPTTQNVRSVLAVVVTDRADA